MTLTNVEYTVESGYSTTYFMFFSIKNSSSKSMLVISIINDYALSSFTGFDTK